MAERKRSYKVGYRDPKVAKTRGLLSRNRWGWAKVYFGQFILFADYFSDEDGNETDNVSDLKLIYPIPNRPPVSWNLTALTEDELMAVKHLFDTAFELALPIVRERDKEAQDALDNGDDSHSRVYRQVPQLVYREGSIGEYRKSLQHGPEDAAGVPPEGRDSDGGLRAPEPAVAEPDES